jgi:hypothetical protein
MTIPEACGLWIEQRVEEELESREKTGASLREIGRKVAAEVEKYFETKVKPGTIAVKAHRMQQSVTNVTLPTTSQNNKESENNQVPQPPPNNGESEAKQFSHGGQREGSGRKPKSISQKVFWKYTAARLERLVDDIRAKGEFPPDVTTETRSQMKTAFSTLSIMMDQYEK